MRLPTYEEISSDERQLEVREWPLDESLFVVGPPGSGKTVLAAIRADMVSDSEDKNDVVVVTFNRMLRRLLYLLNGGSVEASTMHRFVWNDYPLRSQKSVPTHPNDKYVYIWDDMLARLQHLKASSSLSHLVVDEGQDLPVGFFRYISEYVAHTLTIFADEDQALSNRHTTLEQIKGAADLNDPILLKHNHRNTPEVARLAEHFHSGRLPAAIVSRESIGELPKLVRSRDLSHTALLVSNWRQTRGGSVGIIVANNDTGIEIYKKLNEQLPNTRVDIYRHDNKNENSIDIQEDGVTVLNKESVKGQEFDTVFILELNTFIPFTYKSDRRAMYMMCSRARDHLFLVFGPNDLSVPASKVLPGPATLERL